MDDKVSAPALEDIYGEYYDDDAEYYNGTLADGDQPTNLHYPAYILHNVNRESPYLYPLKPPIVSSILHFRIRQLFKRLDPQDVGYVNTNELIKTLPCLIPCISEGTIGRITTAVQQEYNNGSISLEQFYRIIYHLSDHIIRDRDNMIMLTPQFKQIIDFVNNPDTDFIGFDSPTTRTTLTSGDIIAPVGSTKASRAITQEGPGKGYTPRQLSLMQSLEKRSIELHDNSKHKNMAINQSNHRDYEQLAHKTMKRKQCCRRFLTWAMCPCPSHHLPCFRYCNTRVSAKFGASFHHFFDFIGSLIWLNFIIAAILAALVIPSMVRYDWSFTAFSTTRYIEGQYQPFIVYPDPEGFVFGLGMEYSFLFYSDYFSPSQYIGEINAGILWIIVTAGALLLSTIYVLIHILLSTSQSHSPQEQLVRTVFSFDHSPSTIQSYKLQSLHLRSSLLSTVSQLKESIAGIRTQLLLQKRYRLRLRRVIGVFVNTLALASISLGIILLIIHEKSIETEIQGQTSISYISQFSVPIFISCLKVLIPIVVKFIIDFEQRTHADAFKHVTMRIFIMKMFSLLIVLFQTQSNALAVGELATINCRQTLTAVMFYRMIVTDIFIEGFCAIFLPMIMMFLTYLYHCIFNVPLIPKLKDHPTRAEVDEHLYLSSIGINKADLLKPQFEVTENTIDLLYAQTLIWFALPYSPVVPYIGVIYFLCILSFKYIHVLIFSRIPRVSVPKHIQANYINMFFLISLALAMIPFTVFFTTSVGCGPHFYSPGANSQYNTPVNGFSRWIEALPHVITTLIHFFQSPVLLLSLLALLIFIGASNRASYNSYVRDMKTIKLWLSLERQQMKAARKQYHVETKSPVIGTRLMIEFLQALPPQIQASLQTHLYRQYFNDLFYLLLLERNEVVLLLQDWNPSLQPQDTLVQYILSVLDQYRKQLSV